MPEGVSSVRELVVHQDARYIRNREFPKWLNNVPRVVWSCIKMHATHEIVNARRVKQRSMHGLAVHQDARYVRNRELRIEVNHSCNKLHETRGQILR